MFSTVIPCREVIYNFCGLINMLIQNVCLLWLSRWLSRDPLVSEEFQGSQAPPEKKYKHFNNFHYTKFQNKKNDSWITLLCFYRDPAGLMATKVNRGGPVLRYKAIYSFSMLQGYLICNKMWLTDYVVPGSKGIAWITRSARKAWREGRKKNKSSIIFYANEPCQTCRQCEA